MQIVVLSLMIWIAPLNSVCLNRPEVFSDNDAMFIPFMLVSVEHRFLLFIKLLVWKEKQKTKNVHHGIIAFTVKSIKNKSVFDTESNIICWFFGRKKTTNKHNNGIWRNTNDLLTYVKFGKKQLIAIESWNVMVRM